MQLGDLAFGEGDERYARKHKALVEGSHVLLVTRQPVEPLREHHIELSGTSVLEQLLVAGAEPACAAEAMIGIGGRQSPALCFHARAASPHLVLDRGLALQVRAVTGVKGGA